VSSRPGKTAVVYFGTQVGSTVVGFAATWVITNYLGKTVYGRYTSIVALIFWLLIPASAVGHAMNKRISEGRDRDAFFVAGVLSNLAIHGAIAAILLAASPVVNGWIGAPVAPAVAALVLARALFKTLLDALRGYKQVGSSGGLKTFEQTVRATLQIGGIVVFAIGLNGLVVTHAFALAVGMAVGLVVIPGGVGRPTRSHLRRLSSFAQYSWIGTIKSRAFGYADILTMKTLAAVGLVAISDGLIGIYGAAWTVASVLALVSNAIRETLFPELSELSADERYERVQHFLNEGLAFTGVFAIPGFFGALVVGPKLLTIFGPDFSRGGLILVILIGARLLAAYSSQLISVVNAIDRPDMAFRINATYIAANLLLNVALVLAIGWYGAAIATAFSSLLTLVVAGHALASLLGMPELPWREIGAQIAASLVMLGGVVALRIPLPTSLGWTLAVVGSGAGIYGVALAALSPRVREKARLHAPV